MRNSVFKKQITQAETRMTASREFKEGDHAGDGAGRDYRPNHPQWQQAVVLSKTGANSYSVEVRSGTPWRRHADQMITGSTDSWWCNGDRAEIIDGDHGPEPDVETRITQPDGNSEGHTRVKPSRVKGGVN